MGLLGQGGQQDRDEQRNQRTETHGREQGVQHGFAGRPAGLVAMTAEQTVAA
jgi:hypothetical protein